MKLKTMLEKVNKEEIKTHGLVELNPFRIDKRKSFYGKAHYGYIIVNKLRYLVLKSYNTFVAIDAYHSYYCLDTSLTSTRHIKEFLNKNISKKELMDGRCEL